MKIAVHSSVQVSEPRFAYFPSSIVLLASCWRHCEKVQIQWIGPSAWEGKHMAHYIKALCFINSASSPFFHLYVHTTTTMDACDAGCGKYADLRCSGCKSARYWSVLNSSCLPRLSSPRRLSYLTESSSGAECQKKGKPGHGSR